MEGNNLKNQHIMGGRSMKEPISINNNKVRDSWEYCTSHENHHGGDLLSGYLWNPRSYTCSFCKREFRSAQALGGHMNVHRRDRARLRQYSPPNPNPNPNPNCFLNLNLDPNPNPNPNQNPNGSFSLQSSSPSNNSSQITSSILLIEPEKCVIEGSPCHFKVDQDSEKIKYSKARFGVGKFEGFGDENAKVVRLDLEIGLIRGEKEAMDLDLELRLGR